MAMIRDVYGRVPIPVQNVLFSAAGAYRRQQRHGGRFRSFLAFLKESEWWDEPRIVEYQLGALNALFDRAVSRSPFYREFYADHPLLRRPFRDLGELAELPLLRKDDFRDRLDDLRPTGGRSSTVRLLTSGTTGSPLPVVQTTAANQAQWATWWRFRARFGVSPRDRQLTVGARVPVPPTQSEPPYWRWDWANNRCYLSAYHLQPRHLPQIARFIAETPFDFFGGYPSALVLIAEHMVANGIRLSYRPKAVLTGADALTPAYARCLEEAFGCPASDHYGMTEFAGNLSRCRFGNYHDDFECGIVEALPIAGAPDGSCRLVLTGLLNPAMPLVRYDIGDSVVPLGHACPCGRKTRAYSALHGRSEDYIVLPDGRRIGGMNQVLEYGGPIREAQINQTEAARLVVRYVVRRPDDDIDRDAILREFGLRGVETPMVVDFERVDAIAREPNGKFKAVVCNIS